MEMTTTHSFSYSIPKTNLANSTLSPCFYTPKSTTFHYSSVNFLGTKNLNCSARILSKFVAITSSASASASQNNQATTSSVRWLLQPIGDGDSRHIGYKIAMPGSFEIASDVVTVGRVREKADIVISVPTVSGLHARIQKTEENLMITDLDSTNGTFIDEKRLAPGVVSTALPGNIIIFGDTNLAIFRVYKLEEEEFSAESEKSEEEPSSIVESTS